MYRRVRNAALVATVSLGRFIDVNVSRFVRAVTDALGISETPPVLRATKRLREHQIITESQQFAIEKAIAESGLIDDNASLEISKKLIDIAYGFDSDHTGQAIDQIILDLSKVTADTAVPSDSFTYVVEFVRDFADPAYSNDIIAMQLDKGVVDAAFIQEVITVTLILTQALVDQSTIDDIHTVVLGKQRQDTANVIESLTSYKQSYVGERYFQEDYVI